MLRKFIDWSSRFLLGLFILYLFLGFMVVPLVISWGIEKKGSEVLKHPVTIQAVGFNPILLKLTLHELNIADPKRESLIGFHKFVIDLSFKALLKKKIELENVYLDGLKVNVVLQPQGKINLLSLIPESSSPGTSTATSTQPTRESKSSPQELPLVIFDRVALTNGEINFKDTTVSPEFSNSVHDIRIDIAGLSTDPATQPKIDVQAGFNQQGHLAVTVISKPFQQPLTLETSAQMNGYALNVLSPYVGKYTGRALKDGKLDFKIDYRVGDQQLAANHKILIQHFDFGDNVNSPDALNLPFGLAIALLEDPQGKINITLPVKGDMSDPKFEYWHLVGQVARNFFMKLVTKPFTMIGSLLGAESGTEELSYVHFLPGKSEISEKEKEKLKILVKGLKERPKLLLEIPGTYDANVDWKAIKTELLDKDFTKLRKESTKNDLWVYQELYERRFGIRALWRLAKKFKMKSGDIDESQLFSELKRQLIEDSPPDQIAVKALALSRAKTVFDFLVAEGFDPKRVSLLPAKEAMTSLGEIPLELSLTVFGESQASQP